MSKTADDFNNEASVISSKEQGNEVIFLTPWKAIGIVLLGATIASAICIPLIIALRCSSCKYSFLVSDNGNQIINILCFYGKSKS